MDLLEIAKLTDSKIVTGENLDLPEFGFSSDLMSDVLRVDEEDMVLITGLSNLQVIRTADVMDIPVVIIVRGKFISDEMIQLAKDKGVAILSTKYSMFKISGILYKNGIKEVY
ncbi:MAG: hypothetical protein CR982_10335 [Candidatus Cloacimonadota bacterium]|nr:MAG: hypothetical protein CR982_10335 [Candidatus Cloacimonadota bacterium]PIE79104.1 MAG: hypothetical protein CSA15_04320 [Candidatus Delongbacteria bacterium]